MPPLDHTTLSALLVQLCRTHRNLAETRLAPLGLHTGQEFVLTYLASCAAPTTQTDLAAALCVEAPTVTRTLQRLEKSGLVARQPHPDDARAQQVTLTEDGQALLAPVHHIWHDLEATLLTGMTDAEVALLRRLLQQAFDNLSNANSP